MAVSNTILGQITTTSTFSGWLNNTNESANALTSVVLTSDAGSYAGSNTVPTTGNVTHNGNLIIQTVIANTIMGVPSSNLTFANSTVVFDSKSSVTIEGTMQANGATFSAPINLPANGGSNNEAATIGYVASVLPSVSYPISSTLGGTGANNTATSGKILVGNGSAFVAVSASGDATIAANGLISVLSSANTTVTAGTYGNTTYYSTFTVGKDGRLTSANSYLLPSGGSSSGAAGGDLSGTYPNPTVSKINGTVPAAVATSGAYSDLTGKPTIPTSLPPNGSAGGSLAGSYPNPTLANTTVVAGTYGNTTYYGVFTVNPDGRIASANTRVVPTTLPPSGAAGGDLSGTYPNPTIATIGGSAVGNMSLQNANNVAITGGNISVANAVVTYGTFSGVIMQNGSVVPTVEVTSVVPTSVGTTSNGHLWLVV